MWTIESTGPKKEVAAAVDHARPPEGAKLGEAAQFERAKSLLREEVRDAPGPAISLLASGDGATVSIQCKSIKWAELDAPEPASNADGARNDPSA